MYNYFKTKYLIKNLHFYVLCVYIFLTVGVTPIYIFEREKLISYNYACLLLEVKNSLILNFFKIRNII